MALTYHEMMRALGRELGPLFAQVTGMVKRGVIRRVRDAARQQLLQLSLLEDETADEVEHVQPWGLSFVPPAGAEVVALSVGGAQEYLVALGATTRSHRPTGSEEGEGGLYTLTGWKVFCDQNGNVYLGAGPDRANRRVALAELVQAEFAKVQDALSSAQAPSGTAGGPVTYGTPYTAVGDVGSEKVWAVTSDPEGGGDVTGDG